MLALSLPMYKLVLVKLLENNSGPFWTILDIFWTCSGHHLLDHSGRFWTWTCHPRKWPKPYKYRYLGPFLDIFWTLISGPFWTLSGHILDISLGSFLDIILDMSCERILEQVNPPLSKPQEAQIRHKQHWLQQHWQLA